MKKLCTRKRPCPKCGERRAERQSDYLRLARRDALRRVPTRLLDTEREKAQKEAAESWPQHDWFNAEVYNG